MKGKSVTQCAEHLEGLIKGKEAAKGKYFHRLFLCFEIRFIVNLVDSPPIMLGSFLA